MEKNKTVFSLAPEIPKRRSGYDVYKTYFDAVLNNKSIHNIAFTGNFGTGKSSFLKWYTRRKRFLFVSLCDYSRNEKKSVTELGSEICRQLYLGCEAKRRKTLFSRIALFLLFTLISSIVTYFLLLNNKYGCTDRLFFILDKFGRIDKSTIKSSDELVKQLREFQYLADLICGIGAFFGVPLIATWIFTLLSSVKLSIAAKAIEATIEIQKNQDISIFDINKAKLIETLKKSAKSIDYVVIFEDFDRTDYDNCRLLFSELRELNFLINNSLNGFQKNKPIRFIYVIQDDLFGGEEKKQNLHLKFFDYILSYIPNNYSHAAADVIYDCLTKVGVSDNSIYEYIYELNGRLYDYREIRSIANEYQIFRDVYLNSFNDTQKYCATTKTSIFKIITKRIVAFMQVVKEQLYRHGILFKQRKMINRNVSANYEHSLLALATYKTLMPEDYAKVRTGEPFLSTFSRSTELHPCVKLVEKWIDDKSILYIGLNSNELNRYLSKMIITETNESSKEVCDFIIRYFVELRTYILSDSQLLENTLKRHSGLLLLLEIKYFVENENISLVDSALQLQAIIHIESDHYYTDSSDKISRYIRENLPCDKCLSSVISYILRYDTSRCFNFEMVFRNGLAVSRFLCCMDLSTDNILLLLTIAHGVITAYLNSLSSEDKELVKQSINPLFITMLEL